MYVRDSSLWQYNVYADIRGFSGEEASNDCVVENGDFSVPSVCISSETLEIRPTLLYVRTFGMYIFRRSKTPKQITLSDLEWSFYLYDDDHSGRFADE